MKSPPADALRTKPLNPKSPEDTMSMNLTFNLSNPNVSPCTRSNDSSVYDALIDQLTNMTLNDTMFNRTVHRIFEAGGYIELDDAGRPTKESVGHVVSFHGTIGKPVVYAHMPIYSRRTGDVISYLSAKLTETGVSGIRFATWQRRNVWRTFSEQPTPTWAQSMAVDKGIAMLQKLGGN